MDPAPPDENYAAYCATVAAALARFTQTDDLAKAAYLTAVTAARAARDVATEANTRTYYAAMATALEALNAVGPAP